MLSDVGDCQQLLSLMSTRQETFVISRGHRRTHSDYGREAAQTTAAEAAATPVESETVSGHRRLSQRLSLDTRPTASTWKPPCRVLNQVSQRQFTDDLGNPTAVDRPRHFLEDGGGSSGSSSDDSDHQRLTTTECERRRTSDDRRPQSAWNSRSGRRPQFTFSDMNVTDDIGQLSDETSRTTRRKSTVDDDCGGRSVMMTFCLYTMIQLQSYYTTTVFARGFSNLQFMPPNHIEFSQLTTKIYIMIALRRLMLVRTTSNAQAQSAQCGLLRPIIS